MTNQEIVQRTPQQELVAQIRGDDFQGQIALALDGSGISPAKFVRVAITAINENADLVGAERASLFGALMRCAQFELLPDAREAAIVMFGNKAVLMVMVTGMRKIAAEHGIAILAFIVHENDTFEPDFENARANYKPVRLGTDPGDPIGAYAVAQHKDGRQWLEVMNLQEIEAVRATSRAKNSGPWVDFWGEMARKTVVRRLFKSLPLDPKDRERIDRVLAAAGEDGIVELYGPEDQQAIVSGTGAAVPGEAEAEPGPSQAAETTATPQPSASAEVPFEGEEPPPVTEEPAAPEEPTFSAGRYAGKTIPEIWALGKEGASYLTWAYRNWKQEPLRSALDAFAANHPDITS